MKNTPFYLKKSFTSDIVFLKYVAVETVIKIFLIVYGQWGTSDDYFK